MIKQVFKPGLATGVVVTAAAWSVLPTMLAERTVVMRGVAFHSWWLWTLIAGVVGICLVAFNTRRQYIEFERESPRWPYYVIAVLSLVLLAIPLPPMVAIGLCLTAATSLTWAITLPKSFIGLAYSLRYATAAWIVVCLVYTVLAHIEPRLDWGEWLGRPLAFTLQVLGADASYDQGMVYVRDAGYTHRVLASPDKFGGVFPLLFAVALTCLGSCYGARMRTLAVSVGLTLVYAMIIGAWHIMHGIHGPGSVDRWWSESSVLLAYTPLMLIQAIGLSRSVACCNEPTSSVPKSNNSPSSFYVIARKACVGIGGSMLVLGWLWAGPGKFKSGSVMIDEHYSDWEPSDEPIDTTRFGVRTVYNYWNLAEALQHYFEVTRNDQPITDDVLKDVSVLVLKTPTRAYEPETLDAIERFVSRGGGLWLIGDHTNVFGMTHHLNTVGARFGFEFASDAVIDVDANRQLMQTHAWDHPIVRRMPLFLWMTGHSTKAPFGTRDVVARTNLLCDEPDFSQNTGFGDFMPSLDERIGTVSQVLAVEHGRGRVAHWSDSTVFSNFAVFYPGKFEVALGFIDWLRRENTVTWARPGLLLLGSIMTLVPCMLRPRLHGASFAPVVWVGLAFGHVLTTSAREAWYPPLKPHTPLQESVFVEYAQHPIQQPVLSIYQDPLNYVYSTAFLAMQRVGWHPRFASELDASAPPRLIMIAASGGRDLTPHDIDSLIESARAGSTVNWLDLGAAPPWVQAKVLNSLGITWRPYTFEVDEELKAAAALAAGDRSSDVLPAGPVLVTSDGIEYGSRRVATVFDVAPPIVPIVSVREEGTPTVLVSIPVGRGWFNVSGTVDLFSDASLGTPSDVPSPERGRVLELLFHACKQATAASSAESMPNASKGDEFKPLTTK